MKTWLQKRRCYLIVLAGALLPRLLLALLYPHSIWLVQDEIGALALPAKCAGLHWDDVVATTSYYGFGYYILFTPLFMLTDNFLLIHTFIRISGAVLLGVSPLFSVWIYKNYFKIEKESYVILASLISSYAFSGNIRTATNEYAINFLLFLMAFLLAKLHLTIGNAKKEMLYTGLIVICLLYFLTIHTRMLICVAAFIFMVFMCGWTYKITDIRRYIVVPVVIGGTVLVQQFIKQVQRIVWQSDGIITNGAEQVAGMAVNGIKETSHFTTWFSYLFIVTGNLITLFCCSGMIMLLSFLLIKLIWKAVLRKDVVLGNKADAKYVLMGGFFGICTLTAIAGLALTWGPGLAKGIEKGLGESAYNYKAIHYIRYFGNYASPLLMVCIAFLIQKTEEIKKHFRILGILGSVFTAFWLIVVIPYFIGSGNGTPGFIKAFTLGINENSYAPCMLAAVAMIVLSAVWVFCIRRNKLFIPMALILILRMYGAVYADASAIEKNNGFEMADGGYQLVEKLEKREVEIREDIYCLSRWAVYRYQALLPEYHMIPASPDEQIDRTLVLGDNASDGGSLEKMGYVIIWLDENEWVAVCSRELEKAVKECQEIQ